VQVGLAKEEQEALAVVLEEPVEWVQAVWLREGWGQGMSSAGEWAIPQPRE
jgi:hypothetical protein